MYVAIILRLAVYVTFTHNLEFTVLRFLNKRLFQFLKYPVVFEERLVFKRSSGN